jgi:hypothetical protein
VVAALLAQAIGPRLSCILVDNGLLRKDEAESVIEEFTGHFKTDLHVVSAEDRFLGALAGVVDPQEKRRRIGHAFIECFADEAEKIEGAEFLAQGTLYPDVIESGGSVDGPAATIKLHHNVGGLPKDLAFTLIEPLRDLFKDEVRALGLQLGLPEDIEPMLGHFAHAAHRQPRTGEGMPPDDVVRHAELQAQLANLVFEQIAERLDQLEFQILGQSAHVMVQFDGGGRAVGRSAAFDHVRIQRALRQETAAFDLCRLVGKTLDKSMAYAASFFLRIGNAGQRVEKFILGLYHVQIRLEMIGKFLDDRFFLVFSQQTVIDQDTGELPSDSLRQQSGRDRGIHAAR